MNVLLIDDESSMTDAVKEILEDLFTRKRLLRGSRIDTANNFYQALDHLDNADDAYDLIISDLLMPATGLDEVPDREGPVLNGWHFLYHHILREDSAFYEAYTGKKIVFFSAYKEQLEQYIQAKGLHSLSSRFTIIEKGHIYNDEGGYAKLIDEVEKLCSGR